MVHSGGGCEGLPSSPSFLGQKKGEHVQYLFFRFPWFLFLYAGFPVIDHLLLLSLCGACGVLFFLVRGVIFFLGNACFYLCMH